MTLTKRPLFSVSE